MRLRAGTFTVSRCRGLIPFGFLVFALIEEVLLRMEAILLRDVGILGGSRVRIAPYRRRSCTGDSELVQPRRDLAKRFMDAAPGPRRIGCPQSMPHLASRSSGFRRSRSAAQHTRRPPLVASLPRGGSSHQLSSIAGRDEGRGGPLWGPSHAAARWSRTRYSMYESSTLPSDRSLPISLLLAVWNEITKTRARECQDNALERSGDANRSSRAA